MNHKERNGRICSEYDTFTMSFFIYSLYSSSSRAIVTDMANIGVWHGDITAFNILRMSAESKAICPTHKRVHGWRLTDFDQATKMDPENCLKEDILTLASQPSSVSVSFRGFWGFHGR